MQFSIDTKSGVPFYRQIIEQAKFAIARGDLESGDRLPTVRQLAVDLSINPNTVIRAYRELEIEGVLVTQQGSGTFVGNRRPDVDRLEQQRMLDQILTDMLARASAYGFTLDDVSEGLQHRKEETKCVRFSSSRAGRRPLRRSRWRSLPRRCVRISVSPR